VLGRPDQHGVAIIQGGRKPLLGGPAVAHRDHHRAGAVREPDGPRVLGLQVTHDESAAVQPDDGALRTVGAIGPHRHVWLGGHRAILDLHAGGVGCRCSVGQLGEVPARGDRVSQVGWGEHREKCFEFGSMLAVVSSVLIWFSMCVCAGSCRIGEAVSGCVSLWVWACPACRTEQDP
jgi:hypothetical protein